MPKQSTRHKYRSRRERRSVFGRYLRIGGLLLLLVVLVAVIADWRDLWNYYKTYFNGL